MSKDCNLSELHTFTIVSKSKHFIFLLELSVHILALKPPWVPRMAWLPYRFLKYSVPSSRVSGSARGPWWASWRHPVTSRQPYPSRPSPLQALLRASISIHRKLFGRTGHDSSRRTFHVACSARTTTTFPTDTLHIRASYELLHGSDRQHCHRLPEDDPHLLEAPSSPLSCAQSDGGGPKLSGLWTATYLAGRWEEQQLEMRRGRRTSEDQRSEELLHRVPSGKRVRGWKFSLSLGVEGSLWCSWRVRDGVVLADVGVGGEERK